MHLRQTSFLPKVNILTERTGSKGLTYLGPLSLEMA